MSITHREAFTALGAAVAKADELGVKVAIAIVDDHADLVALIRMEDASFLFLSQAAQGKAMASMVWHQPSGDLTEVANTPMFQATNRIYHDQLVFQQGALPIVRDGRQIGAIGVGGALPAQDEEIASAGVVALLGASR